MPEKSVTISVFEENFKDSYTFKIVNIDELQNRYFIEKYSLYTKSVVLAQFDKDGKQLKANNLPEVWSNIRNKGRFKSYIKVEMARFLK